jgi:hypothetical protein
MNTIESILSSKNIKHPIEIIDRKDGRNTDYFIRDTDCFFLINFLKTTSYEDYKNGKYLEKLETILHKICYDIYEMLDFDIREHTDEEESVPITGSCRYTKEYIVEKYKEIINKNLKTLFEIDMFPILVNNNYKYDEKKNISKEYDKYIKIAKKLGLQKHTFVKLNDKEVCNLEAAGFICDICNSAQDFNLCKKYYEIDESKIECKNPILWNDKCKKNAICCNKCNPSFVSESELYKLHSYCKSLYKNSFLMIRVPNVFYEKDKKEEIKELMYVNSSIGKNIIEIVTSYIFNY